MVPLTGQEIFNRYLESHGLAREEDILALESDITSTLPSEYRDFLRGNNGGYISVNVQFPVGGNVSFLHMIYGVGYVTKPYLVSDALENLPQLRAKQLLPIACDPINSQICISLRAHDFGSIHYWDWTRKDDEDNVTYLAKNFSEFQGLLRLYFDWLDFPPTSEAAITKFESRLATALPPDYKEFLKANNGRKALSHVCFSTSKNAVWQLNRILGIGLSWRHRAMDIATCLRKHGTSLPPNLLPFAVDRIESLVCFQISDGKCGKVVFWHAPTLSVIPVCHSFTDFLNLLLPCPHTDPTYFVNTRDQYFVE